ncbi:Golgi-associated plant pathogenesis-related protein 1-like [Ixodes scapularis]|uniref:Golgi-associated plant pathogenesis-related protein 1-like n=1 Tax=Ixodes scapularis TaxID=6945 RepID=UPI001A9E729E|nr:Golgi-associated plant pathogenesis-related protein 1-like [Ixodes scapularis]
MKGTVLILIAALLVFEVTSEEEDLGKSKYIPKRGGIQEAFVKWHNVYRKEHRTPSLQYHSRLSAMAKNWAEHIASTHAIRHRPPSREMSFGENLYSHTHAPADVKINPKKVVTMWYDEIKHYSYAHPYYQSDTSHFTQVVWKDTQYVGCGWAHNPEWELLVVVCNYWKQGNIPSEFGKNVLPKK